MRPPSPRIRPLAALAAGIFLCGVWPAAEAATPEAGQVVADVDRLMAEAEASLESNERQLAESRFREALLEGWIVKGAIDYASGRREAARRAFERAASVAVETRRARTCLAFVHLELGDAERAVAVLRRVVQRDPTAGNERRLLAQALVASGRAEEAVQELEEVVFAVPDDLESAFALASGYLRLGKLDAAEAVLARIAEQRPIPQTKVLIGRTYRDFRHLDHARAALEAALEQDPAVRRARYYLGTIELLARGQDGLDAALALFSSELERFPDDPMTHLYLGLALAEARRFSQAIPALEIAAAWPPTRLDALRFLGRCHLGMERPREAADYLRQALSLAEATAARPRQMAGILYQLGTASRQLGARDEAGRYLAEAQRYSSQIIAAERDRFADLVDSADDVLEQSPWGLAPPADIARLIELGPEVAEAVDARVETALVRAYFNLGVLQAQNRRFARAAELFESAAEIDPDFPQLARSLGVAHFNAERFDRAAPALARALEQDPGNLDLERMLALAWLNVEDYGSAAALLADRETRGGEASLHYAYALALVRSDRAEEAGAVFATLMEEHAAWPELHVLLGQAHAQQGDFARAVASLERARELDPAVAEASLTLGIIYLKQGRLEDAEKALRDELSHHPDDIAARYHLGVTLDLGQRQAEAAAALESVLRAQPDHSDARYLLGKIRLAAGLADEAVVHLEAAAALAPADANVRYQLAQAYRRLGKAERASEELAAYRALKARERESGP